MTPLIHAITALWLFGAQMPTFAPIASPASVSVAKTPIVDQLQDATNMVATVSAYTGVETCKNTACTMANGKRAHVGAVACPRKLKLGTVVTIEGFGDLVCSDRTAMRYDGRYDVFMGHEQQDHDRAIQFGIQKRKITICD